MASRLYDILEYNDAFVASKGHLSVARPSVKSARKSVIVTCMALNVQEGDAKLIKNAGAVITHPFGGIMRSVIVALYELHADEVFVVGHHDCGMSKINPAHTLTKMVEAGIKPETITTLEYAGINIQRWLHGFDSVTESVITSVKIIRNHPLVPAGVPVHGLIMDPETGKLDLLIDGNEGLHTPPPPSASAIVASSALAAAAAGGADPTPVSGDGCAITPADAAGAAFDDAAAVAGSGGGGGGLGFSGISGGGGGGDAASVCSCCAHGGAYGTDEAGLPVISPVVPPLGPGAVAGGAGRRRVSPAADPAAMMGDGAGGCCGCVECGAIECADDDTAAAAMRGLSLAVAAGGAACDGSCPCSAAPACVDGACSCCSGACGRSPLLGSTGEPAAPAATVADAAVVAPATSAAAAAAAAAVAGGLALPPPGMAAVEPDAPATATKFQRPTPAHTGSVRGAAPVVRDGTAGDGTFYSLYSAS